MLKKDFCLGILSKISYQKHLVLSIFFLFTFVFIIALFNLKFSNGIYNYIDKNSVAWKNFLTTEKAFSSTSDIKIIVTDKTGIFNLETIRVLTQLQNEIVNVDYKILEKRFSKFYNDVYLEQLSYYFFTTMNNTLLKLNVSSSVNKDFLDALYETENLYKSISLKNEFFKISEAENIVTIFKHNEKYILKIFKDYSNFYNKNKSIFTVATVDSFFNSQYPVYTLNNYDKIFNKFLSLGFNKTLINKIIEYILDAKISNVDELSTPFIKFIGFEKNDLSILEKNKKQINTIITTIQNEKTFIQTQDLLSNINDLNNEKLEWLKLKILTNKQFNKSYFSEDLSKTVLKIIPIANSNRESFYSSYKVINKIVEHYRWKYPNLIFTELGDPVLSFWSGKSIISDSKTIFVFFILLVFMIIAILLQQVPVIIFYIVASVSSLAWTFGTMSIFNVEFTFLSCLLIPYTLALNAIFTVFFYEFFLRNKNVFDFVCKSPLTHLLAIALPIFATSFFAKSSAIFYFMLFLFFTTLVSLLINMVILPAYVRMTGFVSKITLDKPNFVNELIYFFNRNQIGTIFTLIALIIIFIPGLRNLQISYEGYNSLEKTNFVRNTYNEFNNDFYGAETITIGVYSKDKSLSFDEKLSLIDILNTKLENNDKIGSVSSLVDFDLNTIDAYPESIKQNFVDSKGNMRAIVSIKTSQLGFFRTIKNYFVNILKKEAPYIYSKINLVFSGEYALKYTIVVDTLKNLYFIIFLASILIFLLLCYLSGSIINTVKIILPSASSLFIVYGFMGYLNITIEFGSIIAGFFTFLFGVIAATCLKNIYDYFKISICIFLCITVPFLTLLLSSYQPLSKFGLIMFFTMLISSLSSMLILPTTQSYNTK